MPDPSHYHANLQRGSLLLNNQRPREALPFIQAAIAANPDAPHGYAELARCWNAIPAERHKAIGAIDRAIALAPNTSFYLGLKAWYLVCLMRYHGALKTARDGLAINPNCPQSLNSLANAYTKLNRWKKAEETCRRILARDPNDVPGLNLLAQALRHQGRWKETREVVAQLLAHTPNNAFGQANAGYAALAVGDHLRANEHFREALRMDPHFDLARRGLIESLNARNWMVRLNLRVASWTRRPLRGWWTVAVTTFFVLVFLSFPLLNMVQGQAWAKITGHILAVIFFAVIGFLYVSRAVGILGKFVLIFDPIGRHALTRREKIKASIPVALVAAIELLLLIGGHLMAAALVAAIFLALLFSAVLPLVADSWWRRRAKIAEE